MDLNPNQATEKEECPPIFLACKNIDLDCFQKLAGLPSIEIFNVFVNQKNILHYLIAENEKFAKENSVSFGDLKIMSKNPLLFAFNVASMLVKNLPMLLFKAN